MAINLTENVKTYLTYAGIAINSAAVGALILLAGQGINNWRHPKVLASAITGDMLRATHGADVDELTQRRTNLQGQTADLNRAQDTAQNRVNEAQRQLQAAQTDAAGAGDAVTEAQRNAVTDAQRALEAARAAFAAAQAAVTANTNEIADLTAQIAVNNVFANADQLAVLVDRINHVAPVSQAPAPAPAGEGNQ